MASVGGAAKTLDATNNRLRSLEGLDSLVNLQRLVVARNQLTELPASIGSLQQLKASFRCLYMHALAGCLRTCCICCNHSTLHAHRWLDSLLNALTLPYRHPFPSPSLLTSGCDRTGKSCS